MPRKKPAAAQPSLFFGLEPELPAHVVRPSTRSAARSKPEPEREIRVRCRAVDCVTPINPVKLMCALHWHQVPAQVQKRILQHYRPGQTIETASRPYLLAAAEAVEAVAAIERRDPTNIFRRLAEEGAGT